MKRRSTILTPFSFAIFSTSFGVIRLPPCRWEGSRADGDLAGPAGSHDMWFVPSPPTRPRLLVTRPRLGFRLFHALEGAVAAAAHRVLAVRRGAAERVGRF